jgi:hypothetical protein
MAVYQHYASLVETGNTLACSVIAVAEIYARGVRILHGIGSLRRWFGLDPLRGCAQERLGEPGSNA